MLPPDQWLAAQVRGARVERKNPANGADAKRENQAGAGPLSCDGLDRVIRDDQGSQAWMTKLMLRHPSDEAPVSVTAERKRLSTSFRVLG